MMHSIRKEMFCVGVVVASCCATVGVFGANYAFPSAGGDISSAEAWNGAIPGEADSIDISQPSDKYKITKDVTFGNIRFTADYIASADETTDARYYVDNIRVYCQD